MPSARSASARSAPARPRSTSCVTTTRVAPVARPISGSMVSSPAGSRWAAGSSSRSRRGRWRTQRQTAARWSWPAERVLTSWSRRRASPTALEQLRDPVPAVLDAVEAGVEGERLGERQVAVEERVMAEVADPAARLPRPSRELGAEHRELARRRPQQGREHPQQRRLAGAVRAEDDERLAGRNDSDTSRRTGCSAEVAPERARGDRRAGLAGTASLSGAAPASRSTEVTAGTEPDSRRDLDAVSPRTSRESTWVTAILAAAAALMPCRGAA